MPDTIPIEKIPCDVCGKNPMVGVAGVPCIPVSVAYCRECIDANAHPYELVVANTAIVGGLKESSEYWQKLVADTLKHLGKTDAEFDADVAKVMAENAGEAQ